MCSYSIGSSMVTMCRASRRLISSTSAASVVVLPDPVGPPTSTSPRGSCASSSTDGGNPSVDSRGTRVGSSRTAAAARPRSRCRLIRKRPRPVIRNDASAMCASRYCRRACGASAGSTASSMSRPSSGPSASGIDLAVHADRRRRAGHEQQIAAAARRQQPQPPLEPAAVPHHRRRAGLHSRMELENQAIDVLGVGHGG